MGEWADWGADLVGLAIVAGLQARAVRRHILRK
jgi:hypothetical protein